jgi:lipid II:glycine glycyltransferase (peptidoglycan interpeptide bridge formation enzyme)
MISIKEKFGLRLMTAVLEEPRDILSLVQRQSFDQAIIHSYEKLELPTQYRYLGKKLTPRLSLDRSREEIFKNYSDTVRNEINKSYKIDGLEIRLEQGSDESYTLYRHFEKFLDRTAISRASFNQLLLANAYYQGYLISSIACQKAKPTLRVFAIYSQRHTTADDQLKKIIAIATRRLVHELVIQAIADGYRYFDLGYVSFDDPKKKGLLDFKMKFGATVVDEYMYRSRSKRYHLLSGLITFINTLKRLRQ